MHFSRKYLIVGGSVLALAAGGAGVAIATGGGEGENTATGPGADQAAAAALKITGGGHANAVERDSAHGATWEVEVTKPDGNTVDVYLDESNNQVATEGDGETRESGEGQDGSE
jgi:hypothetical protein